MDRLYVLAKNRMTFRKRQRWHFRLCRYFMIKKQRERDMGRYESASLISLPHQNSSPK